MKCFLECDDNGQDVFRRKHQGRLCFKFHDHFKVFVSGSRDGLSGTYLGIDESEKNDLLPFPMPIDFQRGNYPRCHVIQQRKTMPLWRTI